MVKSTYVLDVETAAHLDRLAKEWQVSKSEALRRVIRLAPTPTAPDRLAVFRELQREVRVSRQQATTWSNAVKAERRTARPVSRRRT